MFFGVDDTQPDMYVPEKRLLNLIFLMALKNLGLPLKKTLQNFDGENSFFNSIIYGLMHKKLREKKNLF